MTIKVEYQQQIHRRQGDRKAGRQKIQCFHRLTSHQNAGGHIELQQIL